MQIKNQSTNNIINTNLNQNKINLQKITDIEIAQTLERLYGYKELLDNFYKKNLFPIEIYSNLNYSLKFSLDMLKFYRHKILVCGTINSGKTTFINTILQENILDFSSLENSKWPIIIRNKNKENQFIKVESKSKSEKNEKSENNQNYKLYSCKLIKSKFLFEFENKTLLAEGKSKIRDFLKDLNINENLENMLKELQFNSYEQQIKLNNFSEASFLSNLNNSNIGDDNSFRMNNYSTNTKRKNILERSLEEINKTIDNLDDIEIINVDRYNKEKYNNQLIKKEELKCIRDRKDMSKKDNNIIKIEMKEYNKDENKLLIQKQFRENLIFQNESFVKYLKENNLLDKLLEKNEIDEKLFFEYSKMFKKFKKEEIKTKRKTNKVLSKIDSNAIFSPFLFDEKISNFIFILELDFDELLKQNNNCNFLFNDGNFENFEIWDIPGLNSTRNHISEIIINNLINNEKIINENFSFLNDKRLLLIYLSECNHFNHFQNKSVWDKLSLLREYTSENYFVLNKIDLFSVEDFKNNNIRNFSNINKMKNSNYCKESKLKEKNVCKEINNNLQYSTNKSTENEEYILEISSESEKEKDLVFGCLKNLVKSEFHFNNNNSFYNNTDYTINLVNLKTMHNSDKNYIINTSGNLNNSGNNNHVKLNTTGNIENYGFNKYKNYFFQSENTSVFLISSLYSFLDNAEYNMNLNEDYWDLKKNIFETNALLIKEYKNFTNFRKHFEYKMKFNEKRTINNNISEDNRDFKDEYERKEKDVFNNNEFLYLPKFQELMFEIKFSISKRNLFSKICANYREFIKTIIYEEKGNLKNFEFNSSVKSIKKSFYLNWSEETPIKNNNFKVSPNHIKKYNSEETFTKLYQNFYSNDDNYKYSHLDVLKDENNKKRKPEDFHKNSYVDCKNIEVDSKHNFNSLLRNRAYSQEFYFIPTKKEFDYHHFKQLNKNMNNFSNNSNCYFSVSDIYLSYTANIFEFYLKNLQKIIGELINSNKDFIEKEFFNFKKKIEAFIDDILIIRESKVISIGELYKNFITKLIQIKIEFKEKLEGIYENFVKKIFFELDQIYKNDISCSLNFNNNNDSSMQNNLTKKTGIKNSIMEYFVNKIIFDKINEKMEEIENQFNFKVSKIIFDITIGLSSGLVNGILAFCGTNLIQTILNSKLIFFSSVGFCFTVGIGCLIFFSFRELKNINSTNKQNFLEQNEKMMKFMERYVEESNNYLDVVLKKIKKNNKNSFIKINGFVDFLKNVKI